MRRPWQLLRDGFAQRAARVRALQERVGKLETEQRQLAENLADMWRWMGHTESLSAQIAAHLAARPTIHFER